MPSGWRRSPGCWRGIPPGDRVCHDLRTREGHKVFGSLSMRRPRLPGRCSRVTTVEGHEADLAAAIPTSTCRSIWNRARTHGPTSPASPARPSYSPTRSLTGRLRCESSAGCAGSLSQYLLRTALDRGGAFENRMLAIGTAVSGRSHPAASHDARLPRSANDDDPHRQRLDGGVSDDTSRRCGFDTDRKGPCTPLRGSGRRDVRSASYE